jgi:hypothetical protein
LGLILPEINPKMFWLIKKGGSLVLMKNLGSGIFKAKNRIIRDSEGGNWVLI